MIDELSLRERIRFLPSDADKVQIFSDTDIVLLPSCTEGLPLVALEAQAAHVLVLLSDHISFDANLGLAIYAEYNALSEWNDAVKRLYSQKGYFDTVKISTNLIETSGWCNRIGEIYNGE